MIIRAFMKKRFSFFVLLIVPLIIILSFYYVMKLTIDEVEVPIVFVDAYDQPFVQELIDELGDVDPFQIRTETEMPWDELVRGDIEAVFYFKEDVLNNIHESNVDELITWYRHEQSLFDGLIKEKLASTIVNYIVRAEAANIISYYDEDANWEEAYLYGLRYLGPEPIFQMGFQSFQGTSIDNELDLLSELSFPRLVVWLYCIIFFTLLAQTFLTWHQDEIFKRLKLIPYGTLRIYLTWFVFVVSVGALIATLILNVIHYYLFEGYYDASLLMIDLLAIIATALLILLGTKIFKRKESFIAFVLTYTVSSIVIFLLIEVGLLNYDLWMNSFIPIWLLI